MTKLTIAAVALFALGAVVGRSTAQMPALASEASVQTISIDELTRKAAPLPAESFDAV